MYLAVSIRLDSLNTTSPSGFVIRRETLFPALVSISIEGVLSIVTLSDLLEPVSVSSDKLPSTEIKWSIVNDLLDVFVTLPALSSTTK